MSDRRSQIWPGTPAFPAAPPILRLSSPRAARVAVATLFFVNGALTATWVARIPALQTKHALTHGQLGLALLAMAVGAVVSMPLTGAWIARRGSLEPTRWAALLFCAAMMSIALAPSAALFVGALALTGMIHGTLDVAMNAQAVEVERVAGRPIMSSFHALFSAGGLAGATSGAVFAAAGAGPGLHFGSVAALLAVAAGFVAPLLQPAPPPAPSSGARASQRPSPVLLALGLMAFGTMVGEGAMADWSALYLREVRQSSESVAAMGYAAFSIAMALGRWFGDGLIACIGPVRLARIGGSLATGGMLLALFVPGTWAALLGFAAVGLGLATLVPMVFSAAGRLSGYAPGVALSAVTTLGYLGFLLAPPIIGFLAQAVGLRGALGLLVGTSACLVVFAPVLRPR